MAVVPVGETNRTMIQSGRQEWRKEGIRDSGLGRRDSGYPLLGN